MPTVDDVINTKSKIGSRPCYSIENELGCRIAYRSLLDSRTFAHRLASAAVNPMRSEYLLLCNLERVRFHEAAVP